jgi:hypothetical protein
MDDNEHTRGALDRFLRPGDPWPTDDGRLPTIERLKTTDEISEEEVDDFIEMVRRMRREDLYREPRRESLRLRRFR